MGKGGGCFPSKSRPPVAASEAAPTKPAIQSEVQSHSTSAAAAPSRVPRDVAPQEHPKKKLKIFVVFYSMYGHVESLAKKIKKGIDSVDGVEGCLYRVAETLPKEVLELMKAPPKDDGIPVISVDRVTEADGFLFGFPTRFGSMPAQMKAFFDSTGGLWKEQKLAGVPAGFFFSTGTQGGGQETTAWTAITQLTHHGMLYVPVGYTFGGGMFKMDSIRGGSPYGAGTYAGDGTRVPTDAELQLAEHQGKYMASVVKKLGAPHSK